MKQAQWLTSTANGKIIVIGKKPSGYFERKNSDGTISPIFGNVEPINKKAKMQEEISRKQRLRNQNTRHANARISMYFWLIMSSMAFTFLVIQNT